MRALISLHDRVFDALEAKIAPALMPTLARFVFAATLMVYYWNAGLTKLGDGFFGFINLSFGAYTQITPRIFDAVGYDPSQLGLFPKLIALAGTWAEFILPALVLIGLFSRLAALGMIGVVFVQSYVDIVGHHADATTIGSWFDRIPDSAILDQRAFWVFVLLVIVLRGGGPLSVDALLRKRQSSAA